LRGESKQIKGAGGKLGRSSYHVGGETVSRFGSKRGPLKTTGQAWAANYAGPEKREGKKKKFVGMDLKGITERQARKTGLILWENGGDRGGI